MVESVLKLYNKSLAESKVKASVIGLRHLEETANKNDGSRFLLEMDLQLHHPKEETLHTSEYVYLKKGSSQLCHTTNFQWNKEVEVHFVVSGEYWKDLERRRAWGEGKGKGEGEGEEGKGKRKRGL
jgi:hypothetical protein